ncbi:MAG: thioredoxin family protein, partial [Desulfobacterales bacterium]|nr:thioredoxin family protein [Desulfobacterales bacterium]
LHLLRPPLHSVPLVVKDGQLEDDDLTVPVELQVGLLCGLLVQATVGTCQLLQVSFKVDVLDAKKPVMVIFWSPAVESTFETISMLENLGFDEKGIKLVKIDTYKNRLIADRYQIKEIPTLLYFTDGEVKGRTENVSEENALKLLGV